MLDRKLSDLLVDFASFTNALSVYFGEEPVFNIDGDDGTEIGVMWGGKEVRMDCAADTGTISVAVSKLTHLGIKHYLHGFCLYNAHKGLIYEEFNCGANKPTAPGAGYRIEYRIVSGRGVAYAQASDPETAKEMLLQNEEEYITRNDEDMVYEVLSIAEEE